MKIESYDEWGALKSVVVGTASNAHFPVNDETFELQMQDAGWTETPPPSGPVPQWIIDETNEDLNVLASTLKGLGIKVIRTLFLLTKLIIKIISICSNFFTTVNEFLFVRR